ncbi:MAG: transglycosylase domain-containing protein [Paludibacteraceae bacterium]|nr:transglycosylase domain-containing protein [Paludibacteraceae bacterium]MBO7259114.1 transglycosylase domain-containing protein [Paludibacteraceae bacterium]
MLFWMISKGWLGYLPDIDELQNPKNKYATEIYSSDMQLLGRFFYSKDNRVHVPYSAISPNMINALIATEDERFLDHSGIDGRALMRVLVKTAILQQRNAGGGSTITQQLAKQLYSPTANNLFERILQKPNEWVIATELERLYTKQEIIAMYLNQFDFLNNAVGIKSAAQVYFNTTPAELTIEQAATLVGMCKNPSYYNPVRHNERTFHRRNTVLNQMLKADYITESECDSLKQLPLVLDFHRIDHKEGLAPYFREYLRKVLMAKEPKESNYASWQKQQYQEDLEDWHNNPLYGFCNKNKKADGTPYNIYSDGLRIYTTIDSRMQRYAEDAVSKHMQDLQKTFFKEKKGRSYAPFSRDVTTEEINGILERTKRQSERYRVLKKSGASKEEIDANFNTPVPMQVFSYEGMIDTLMSPLDSIRYHKHFLRCGMYSIDARNGHVKAYVGGPDFRQFQYDMATEGRRQVGSTVKPYLYTLAMEEGMWPCDKVTYQPITLLDANGREWSPKNSDKKADDLIGKEVTLQWGLTNSNNWISAYLMSLYTPESLVKLLRSFGMRGPIDPVISLCLGPCEISVAEMADAYTAFPNKGIRIEPIYVTHIEDKNGNLIATFVPKTHEIFSAETSYKMIHMLRNVIDHGTGVRVRYKYGLDMQMGGKTGTTQNNSDGWFMGFTPSLVTGVWVGGEDRSIHFDRISDGQGANMALPIWALYMKEVLNNPDIEYSLLEEFDIPEEFNPHAGCQSL